VEKNIWDLKLNDELNTYIRNLSLPIINKLLVNNQSINHNDRTLLTWLNSRAFIKRHSEILITRVDKGNNTVALNKTEYLTKMNNILYDETTYEIINHDPLKKIIKLLTSILATETNAKIRTLIGGSIMMMGIYLGPTDYPKSTNQTAL